MDGWQGGWMDLKAVLRIAYIKGRVRNLEKSSAKKLNNDLLINTTMFLDGWMDGYVSGWVDGCKSRFKDCLQQS